MKPEHLRLEVEALAKHVHQRLLDRGYTADEIERSAGGLLDGTRLWPTNDGEHVSGDWLYVEAVRALSNARKALERGQIEAARRHYAEAERNEVAAQREIAGERTSARNAANAGKARKPELAETIAMLAKRSGTAGTLWPDLRSELDRHGMDPEEQVTPSHDEQYAYFDSNGKSQTITKRRFATRLSEARKAK